MNIGKGALGQGHTDTIGDEPEEMGDNLPAIDWGTDFAVSHISCGLGHTCAVDVERGEIKCCGWNGMYSLFVVLIGSHSTSVSENVPFHVFCD